eukprot:jgi/Psemu1/14640/gm1.14640_g
MEPLESLSAPEAPALLTWLVVRAGHHAEWSDPIRSDPTRLSVFYKTNATHTDIRCLSGLETNRQPNVKKESLQGVGSRGTHTGVDAHGGCNGTHPPTHTGQDIQPNLCVDIDIDIRTRTTGSMSCKNAAGENYRPSHP